MMKAKLFFMLLAVALAVVLTAGSASAKVLVYEPFDYPDGWLTGQGGALGTTGTWTTNDTGEAQGWWCHPEGELTGQGDDRGPSGADLNLFDGTVDNLPTSGGFAGPAGPTDQSTPGTWGTRDPTGSLDANIGLDPSVTATFQSGTTTWFSYVGCHADNRNQGSPTFMICTDPTTNGSRGLTMQNSGNGIGGVGGPPRYNLFDVYPHYFSGGVHHQTPGGYLGGVLGDHDGIVTAFCSTGTCDGVLGDDATRAWVVRDGDGFMGVPNIVVGKIEWDADTGGEDVVSVVSFLETDELTEAAFDAIIANKPLLSSRNWPGNKPNLDQSQFDTLNISSLKFWVNEIRIGTTFDEVIGVLGAKDPSPADGATVPTGDVDLSWTNADPNFVGGSVYVDVWFGTEPNELHPGYDMTKVVTGGQDTTIWTVSAPTEGTYYWQVDSYIYGDPAVVDYDNSDPNAFHVLEGSLWSFYALDDAPPTSVDAGAAMITWSGQAVQLDATVVDDGRSALTYLWSAAPADGVVVEFSDTGIEDPTVTITKVPVFVPTVVNGGFEDSVLGNDAYNWQHPGWGWFANDDYCGTWNPTTSDFTEEAPEGQNVGFCYPEPATQEGGFAQILSETLTADTTYTLTVEVGNSPWYDWTGYKVQLLAGGSGTAPGEITGGNLLAEDDSSLTPADYTFATSTVTYTSGGVSDPNVGLPLQIRLLAKPGDDNEIDFDDVQLLIDGEPAGEYVYDPAPVTVELNLAVNDENNPTPVKDTMDIDVYDNACLAAVGAGLATIGPADFDENCITDVKDLAVMLATWLDDIALTAPVPK